MGLQARWVEYGCLRCSGILWLTRGSNVTVNGILVQVFSHIRRRVRECGLADMDNSITADFRGSETPQRDFRHYLSTLMGALTERSRSGYEKSLRAIQESIRTKSGGPVEALEVVAN
jgi:hypothetical protein